MSQVKSNNNNSTELKLISFFKSNSIKGWRRKYNIFGKPDFVFLLQKTAVFVDGCFWHGHPCRNINPKSNKKYWVLKINRNKKRDQTVNKFLRKRGWKVIRIWECELKSKEKLLKKLKLQLP